MNKNIAASLMLFISMLFASSTLYAFDETARKLFDNGQYDECIHRVKSLPNYRQQRSNLMLLAYSNYQQYNFTKEDSFDEEYQSLYDELLKKANKDDLNSVMFLINSSDKPAVVESSRDFLKEIFGRMHRIKDISKILPFTKVSDKETREYAFDAIQNILEPVRDIVKKGGTMRPVDLTYFQNKDVIKSAIANVDISSARNTLILIEQPALKLLGNPDSEDLKDVFDDINEAIADRKEEFPKSSWYSATGKRLKGAS